MENWDLFLAPYQQVVEELKVKLKVMREQFDNLSDHSPIEFVTGRVKPIPSILIKAKEKGLNADNYHEIQDLAGLRIMCQFVDDIYTVIELLRGRSDFEIVEERDYISRNKVSGYRSYHVVISYPVETINGQVKVLAEIQVRTLAMNFWATIEHSINYKYSGQIPENIHARLRRAAEASARLDEEMSNIREEIQEAQKIFHRKK
ncbi:GTP pyrophosphokinase [Lottiidibacillus patelloidae]|uniref:GTP diphosphokinase n=2 Tax=Lottiidibacillus patelloidae TaxID=2670334 RepID=A0A263BX21_9BACI|nr:GTP pyrophosphokinase [Lottiidibacillus patelloidae]